MNRTKFLEAYQTIEPTKFKSTMPDVAEIAAEIAKELNDNSEAEFSPESQAKLDTFFAKAEKQHPVIFKNAKQIIGKRGIELLKRSSELRGKMKQGDKEAAREMLAVLKQKSEWRKQIQLNK